MVHGTLHLLGYDHHDDAVARATWKRAKSARLPGSASPTPMRCRRALMATQHDDGGSRLWRGMRR